MIAKVIWFLEGFNRTAREVIILEEGILEYQVHIDHWRNTVGLTQRHAGRIRSQWQRSLVALLNGYLNEPLVLAFNPTLNLQVNFTRTHYIWAVDGNAHSRGKAWSHWNCGHWVDVLLCPGVVIVPSLIPLNYIQTHILIDVCPHIRLLPRQLVVPCDWEIKSRRGQIVNCLINQ